MSGTHPSDKASPHVLLADQDQAEQLLIAALLESHGYRVTLAADGRKAIEAVLRQSFDVILMAVDMPVMDGIQAARHIRGLPSPGSDVPIIALTAEASSGDVRADGMDSHLNKPLVASTLLPAIQALTDGRPRPSAADSMPALDHSVIDALRVFLSPHQIQELLAESLADIEARIRRLEARLNDADSSAAAKEAHDLVSVAGNCGAVALSFLARDIERSCKQGDIGAGKDRFSGTDRVAAAAKMAIADLIAAAARNERGT